MLVRSEKSGRLSSSTFRVGFQHPVEMTGNRQAVWRSDPSRAGIAGAMADIGTHAFNLAEYITGSEVVSLSAELHSTLHGRKLDDDGTVNTPLCRRNQGTLLRARWPQERRTTFQSGSTGKKEVFTGDRWSQTPSP
jgi:predicted dehydrogenase